VQVFVVGDAAANVGPALIPDAATDGIRDDWVEMAVEHPRRVAVAALETHFAKSLCDAAGISASDVKTLFNPKTHEAIAAFFAGKTRQQLDKLASEKDIPLMTLPKA
jgi:hypothetical protein